MTHADWEGVCERYRTASGIFWPIPITLSSKEKVETGKELALTDPDSGEPLATMRVTEKATASTRSGSARRSSARPTRHPASRWCWRSLVQPRRTGEGAVRRRLPGRSTARFHDARGTRAEFERLGWSRVAAFQTRNPMQRAHEYLAKVAIECAMACWCTRCSAHSSGDIPAEVRTRAIAVLIEKYFRPGTVVQAGYPLDMRYAGPRERCCTRFSGRTGCSHLIVGRDHAGVGKYYGPFDAHRIFDEIPPGCSRPARSRWTSPSGATAATAWPPDARARTGPRTSSRCRARSCASGWRKAPKCRRNSRAPRCSKSCGRTTPRRVPDGVVDVAARCSRSLSRSPWSQCSAASAAFFSCLSSAPSFPFHLDFVRAARLLVALTSSLSAAPSLLANGLSSLRSPCPSLSSAR